MWSDAIRLRESRLPAKTNRGFISLGQLGVSCMTEGVRQLCGEVIGRQVPEVEVGLIYANDEMLACHLVTILSR